MMSTKLFVAGGVAFFLVVAGWIMNLIAFVAMLSTVQPISTLFVGRAVGILFFPLGATLGWFA